MTTIVETDVRPQRGRTRHQNGGENERQRPSSHALQADQNAVSLWKSHLLAKLEAKSVESSKLAVPSILEPKTLSLAKALPMKDDDSNSGHRYSRVPWESSVNRYIGSDPEFRVSYDLKDTIETILSTTSIPHALTEVADNLRSVLVLVAERSERVLQSGGDPRELLDRIRRVLATENSVRDAAMAEILREPMLTEAEADAALTVKAEKISLAAEAYRRRSWLIGLPIRDGDGYGYRYPRFQFDEPRGDVHPAVRDVNQRLNAAEDPWGVASWWLSPHVRLRGRPADLVGVSGGPERSDDRSGRRDADIIAASKALLSPVG